MRRASYVAGLLSRHGVVVIVALISPYRDARKAAREEILRTGARFVEVYVNAPLDVCAWRDPKGLYRKARGGAISSFTGVADPYEAPLASDIECHTDREPVETSASRVISAALKPTEKKQSVRSIGERRQEPEKRRMIAG